MKFESHISKWSLTFHDPAIEAIFTSKKKRLVTSCLFLGGAGFIMASLLSIEFLMIFLEEIDEEIHHFYNLLYYGIACAVEVAIHFIPWVERFRGIPFLIVLQIVHTLIIKAAEPKLLEVKHSDINQAIFLLISILVLHKWYYSILAFILALPVEIYLASSFLYELPTVGIVLNYAQEVLIGFNYGLITYACEYFYRKTLLLLHTRKKNKKQWKNFIEVLPDGVLILEKKEVKFLNSTFHELTEKKLPRSSKSRRQLEDLSEQFSKYKQVQVQGESNTLNDFVSKDVSVSEVGVFASTDARGLESSLEVRIMPLLFKELSCKAVIVRDQTNFAQVEKCKTQEKYLKVMLGSMTHELRTPLNGMLGMIELVEEEGKLSEIGRNTLCVGKSTIKYMELLVQDILDFAEIEAGVIKLNKTSITLTDLLNETMKLMEFRYKRKNLPLELSVKGRIPDTICSDETRYKQILLNLLSNAIKFTQRGSVTVIVKHDYEKGVLITKVKDTGAGIKPEDINKLFKLFGKIEDTSGLNPKGVGFGLTICKKLAQLLGGDISVKSVYGHGTTFSFTVGTGAKSVKEGENSPADRISLEIVEDVESSNREMNSKLMRENLPRPCHHSYKQSIEDQLLSQKAESPYKCLIVDDNEMNRFFLHQTLNRLHVENDEVANGKEAIEAVISESNTSQYKLILMDVNMPIMDGVAATLELVEMRKRKEIKYPFSIIGLTADSIANKEAKKKYLEIGMSDILCKPITGAKIKQLVATYL